MSNAITYICIILYHRHAPVQCMIQVGDIELRAGDVLVLDTGPLFVTKYRDDSNFLLVTEIDDSAPPRFVAAPELCLLDLGSGLAPDAAHQLADP